ncbi:MAG: squalene/phytoene synthase family protein [Sediminimonas sp.]|uniref:squalene/phytoene synthase family protein n=1 Tax=Sediminimonas sp. TaxID=2823379 RepID=UPI0028700B4A|nr:squalene/phytoene synthase family protein [Sediminimonas sp.]MDR9483994.1 squalene/phytoene synthase family protein [Sediminimonas sp.]
MPSDELTACADLVARADPDRLLAVMAAPPALRAVLFPIYAFNVEVSRAPWVTQEPMIAEMRLQWWRDVLDEIRQGRAPRPHEVATPLSGLLDADGAEMLDQLVAARRWDIYRDPFEDAAHFEEYINRTSGHLILVAARAAAPVDARAAEVIGQAGYATGLANWFRAIPALEAAGRKPLPDGRGEAVRDLAHDGLRRLRDARARRDAVPRAVAPVLYAAWQAGPILRRAAAKPGRVADGRVEPSGVGKRAALMLRAATRRW